MAWDREVNSPLWTAHPSSQSTSTGAHNSLSEQEVKGFTQNGRVTVTVTQSGARGLLPLLVFLRLGSAPNCPLSSLCSTVAPAANLVTMDGTASVNSASRPHYASSIPVPRAASQTRIQTPAASPRLRPRQAGLALSPPRAASPRPTRARGSSRGSSPRASRGRGSPRTVGAARESTEGAEGPVGSPWNSPRAAPKASISGQAGSRRPGGTPGTPSRRQAAQEGVPPRQTRGRSPSRTSSHGETQAPGAPEGRKPPKYLGKDQRDAAFRSPGASRSSEPDTRAASGPSSPACSPVQSPRLPPGPGAIRFPSVHQQSQPVTATVAPFQYR